ncbi:MAG: sodium-dependent bicarbonate transport family permease, partial [Candidatus Limnocylindrus sp.]
YAVCAPLAHAAIALFLSALLGLGVGDAALLMVLSASASYIVVPAVIRHAIPEANPALYLGLSLGITFPFNILFGIPLYVALATALLG